MKKFLAILVLGLLWCSVIIADETSNVEWIKSQTDFETSAFIDDDEDGIIEAM